MEITEIKQCLTLSQVLKYYNLKPDKNHRLNCPFHEDKTPSMQVYYKTQTVYCFSSNCKTHGKSMDVIDFVMHKENMDKHQALLKCEELINGKSTVLPARSLSVVETTPLPFADKTRFLGNMFIYFKNAIYNSSSAKMYLEQRNLDYKKIEVGYNGGQFHHGARKDETLIKECLQVGLLTETGKLSKTGEPAYNTFGKWCICFALRNKENQITGLYFRSTLDKKDQRHFYLKDRSGIYPGYPKADTRKLIIPESIIDTASLLQQAEITNEYELLALYGTNGLTEEHLKAIAGLTQLEEVVFFLNGDDAGRSSVLKHAETIKELKPGIIISNVEPPEGEDVNSLLQGHEPEIFTHLLEARVTISEPEEPFLFSTEKEDPAPCTIPPVPFTVHPSPSLNTANPELLYYTDKELKITVLGGIRISGLDRLKVTIKTERTNVVAGVIRHSLDLYHARQVEQLCEMISSQLEISSSKTAEIIGQLTTALENYRQQRLEAMKPKSPEEYRMSDEERKQAVKSLKDPKLMEHTRKDIATCGIVGEENNAMTGYIVNLSRKREKPLHVMYLGSSGSGKTHLQEGLTLLVPEEDRIEATGLSDQSLYYEGLKLQGKILFIEDLDGAENVMYIIRELQSKGRITKRVAWRDNKGNTKTVEVVAQGPVVVSSCTTKEKLYEDNANRCILLYIDQSREQDKKVMDYIKAKSTGKIIERKQEETRLKMQNMQRMLRPVKVYNPFANLIELPTEVFKPRRSLPLLLGFIETVTFYHQYQRELKTNAEGERYIESTYTDIEQSFELLKDVLFSKSDELSKVAREFLEKLKEEVKPGESFYTKNIRKELRINANNLKRYMRELQAYGYLKAKSGNHYRGYEYQVSDYVEYEQLRRNIDKQLEAILLKIRGISGSVGQSGSQVENNHLTILEPVS
jgi:DNA primase